jgi:tryptophan synthase alpha chain
MSVSMPAGGARRPSLEATLQATKANGRKSLVVYLTAGLPGWQRALEAAAVGGADAIEVGIPFSDPIMDGPVIQRASAEALRRLATPDGLLAELASVDAPVALAVMTYVNLVLHAGFERFAGWCEAAGVTGTILPDLPLEECGSWRAVAATHGIANVLLAAPSSPPDRLVSIARASEGFVYAVGLMGVTGERRDVASSGLELASRLQAITDKPVLVGVGISSGAQAARVSRVADGVIVGSAVVRRMLEGASAEEVGAFVAELRSALDECSEQEASAR